MAEIASLMGHEGSGAHAAVNYKDADWPEQAFAFTGGKSLDVILDAQAGDYIQREIDILAVGGRLVLMATHRDTHANVNFRTVVRRRLTISGSVIRNRTPRQKGLLAEQLERHVWPLIGSGAIRTEVQYTFPLEQAVEAHRVMDRNEQAGKLVLVVDPHLVSEHLKTRTDRMTKTQITTDAVGQPIGRFSQAISAPASGRLVFISGMTARRPDGSIAAPATSRRRDATRQACSNIKAPVEAAGGTMAHVCRVDL